MTDLLIVDYGMGNLFSLRRSLEECLINATISPDPASLDSARKVIIPGVGGFSEAMENLRQRGWIPKIRAKAADGTTPIFGICLGMQLLADRGTEGETCEGLGLIPGSVELLRPADPKERIPHMGWNSVTLQSESDLFKSIPNGSDFYFCHSYYFKTARAEDTLAVSDYCGGFACAVQRGNVCGVQFHPEKSSRFGLQLLRNFALD